MTRHTDEDDLFAQLMGRLAPEPAPLPTENRITATVRRDLFPGADPDAWRPWAESMLGTSPATSAASDADLRRTIQQQLLERARLRVLVAIDTGPPTDLAVEKALEILTMLKLGGTPNFNDIAELLRTMVQYRQALETIEQRLHDGEDVADVFAEVLHGEVSDG